MPLWIEVCLALLVLALFIPAVLVWLDGITGASPRHDEIRTSEGRRLPARPPRAPRPSSVNRPGDADTSRATTKRK